MTIDINKCITEEEKFRSVTVIYFSVFFNSIIVPLFKCYHQEIM